MTAQTEHKAIDWALFVRRMVLLALIFPVLLFAAAGTLNWLMAWAYIVLTLVIMIVGRYWMFRRNPDLLEERVTALEREDTKSWDKVMMPMMLIAPLAQIIVAGLDMRFDWSPPFALWIELLGITLLLFGHLFGTWALLVNKFFSSGVRIQTDREHTVVTEGPYAIVRHPGYIGALISNVGVSLMLSSLLSFIPFVLVIGVTIIRTKLEDDTLQAELVGYKEYAQETRYRLIPWLW